MVLYMYCNKCGKELFDGDQFCSKCGNKLVTTQPISINVNTTSKNQNKSTKKIGVIPAIIAILFMLFIFGSFINMTMETATKNHSQLSNTGISSNEISNSVDILQQCGFSNYKIEKDTSLDELEGKRNIGI